MVRQDPVLVHDILGQVYAFTRRPLAGGHEEAFLRNRSFAREALRRIARSTQHDPFNYRLQEAWQLVFDKPWTQPPSMDALINDLADAVQDGRLHVYRDAGGLA